MPWQAMMTGVLTIALAALFASTWLTAVVRRLAVSHGVLDVPNARSSHTMPTPRGGGAAIVLVASAGFAALAFIGALPTELFVSFAGGGGMVALVGFLDDRHRVSPGLRFIVHVGAAVWAVA